MLSVSRRGNTLGKVITLGQLPLRIRTATVYIDGPGSTQPAGECIPDFKLKHRPLGSGGY